MKEDKLVHVLVIEDRDSEGGYNSLGKHEISMK